MRKRLWPGLLAVVLAAAGCAGPARRTVEAGGPPRPGGVLTYATDVQPQAGGLDPYATTTFGNLNVLVQIYEPLLTKDGKDKLHPALASSWKQVDDTTYRFTLREGVTFSDGTPVTTEDVVFSYEIMRDEGLGQKPLLTRLEDIEAVGDRTVEMRLSEPTGVFMNVVSADTSFIVKKKWFQGTPKRKRERTALGTGAFRLKAWRDNVVVSLAKNPHYWDKPRPYLNGVDFQIVPDEQTRYASLQQGTVDAAWLRDPGLANDAELAGLVTGQNLSTRNMYIYLDLTRGPLADVRVRQALSKGLDRKQIVDLAMGGHGAPTLVATAGDPLAVKPDASTPNHTHDVAGAKALLAKAGRPRPTVELTYAADASFALDVPMVEVMKEQLKQAGIELRLNPVTWADVVSRYTTGKWTGMLLVPGVYRPDPSSYFSSLLKPNGPLNKTGRQSARAAELLAELQRQTEPEGRTEALRALENEVADKVLMLIPYTSPQRQEVWAGHVRGYSADPFTSRRNLKKTWLAR